MRENQAGFHPGQVCINQTFTLRQTLEHKHMFRSPAISVFLDLKVAFESVARATLWHRLLLKSAPEKFI